MDAKEFDRLLDNQANLALNVPGTPAYVYSESILQSLARQAALTAAQAECELLYTLKACAITPVLEIFTPTVHGFAASSVFEARLAAGVSSSHHSLHCYSPAYSASEIESTLSLADYLSLNSLNQLDLAASLNTGSASLGLRVNPELSFVPDARYDPSRPGSKLGAPLSDLRDLPRMPDAIEGLHIHNNCESDDLFELARSAEALFGALRRCDNLSWVNLGGGYYLGPETDATPLEQVARTLRAEFGAKLFIEPGTALVQQAGYLVSEVLDVFSINDRHIAVLDTSTSHIPEVFEYQYTPEVNWTVRDGGAPTTLVGRSCLAGDILGEYRFTDPVRIGDRVALKNAGSYSHSRAVPFNGIPIPSVYMLREDGAFDPAATYDYDDFAARNGATPIAAY